MHVHAWYVVNLNLLKPQLWCQNNTGPNINWSTWGPVLPLFCGYLTDFYCYFTHFYFLYYDFSVAEIMSFNASYSSNFKYASAIGGCFFGYLRGFTPENCLNMSWGVYGGGGWISPDKLWVSQWWLCSARICKTCLESWIYCYLLQVWEVLGFGASGGGKAW